MIVHIILLLFILGALVGLPILTVKIYHSNRIKTWQKHLIAFTTIGGSMLFILTLFFGGIFFSFRYPFGGLELSKSVKEARSYLLNVGIDIDFPEFRVGMHRIEFTGGDDTMEIWDINFTEPLSEEFLAKLDSLCSVDSTRWRHYDKWIRHGMSADYIPCYEFSFWNPEKIEQRETVTIIPAGKRAVLTHIKI